MKIEGLGTLIRRGTVTITDASGAAVDLKIAAYPLGFHTELIRDLPGPMAPLKKIGHGKDGPIMERNEKDPKFKAEEARTTHLQSVALAYMALRDETRITWDAKREEYPDARSFYVALEAEAVAAGWTGDAIDTVAKAAVALSDLKDMTDEKSQALFTEADPE